MEKDFQELKKNKKSLKRFLSSFKYCFEGMRYAFYTEQNIIVMFVFAIVSLILGIIFKISYTERLVIVLLIGIVMALEMVNCAIEATVDLVTEEKKPMAKVAKDCASGAVGIISIIALILGIMISTAFLAMWMSSTATVAIMVPISLGIIKMSGAEPLESNFGKALF